MKEKSDKRLETVVLSDFFVQGTADRQKDRVEPSIFLLNYA